MSQQWNIEVINAVRDGVKVGINAKDDDSNIEIQDIASYCKTCKFDYYYIQNKLWDHI